jgi:hypothetical protein
MPRSKASTPSNLQLFYLQRPPPTVPELPSLQTYFPSLEILFPSIAEHTKGSPTLASSELVVEISGAVATVENLVTHEKRTTPFWVRMIHLVEPVDVMSGDYVLPSDGALPTFRAGWQRALRKINDPYNEAYTDAVFACMASRLVETERSPHFCRFYGTFAGRAPTYTYNITDDMPDIEKEPWFHEGQIKGEFDILVVDPYNPESVAPFSFYSETRPVKPVLSSSSSVTEGADDADEEGEGGSDTAEDDSASDEESDGSDESNGRLEEIDDLVAEGEAVVNRRPDRLLLTRVSGSRSASTGSEEDDLEFRAVFRNFPVQFTVLERCDGTMDDLMEDEIDEEASADMQETKEARWTAWMFQVIAGLTVAQATYDFVHNDLHTNNVMWCGTGITHLYYKITGAAAGDRVYRVPTYGRIFKIIDFGRATFRPPTASSSKKSAVWIPDAFAPGADAEGQYNCGQYFKQGAPKIGPNRSFDLSRLAVAILDTLWLDQPAEQEPKKVLTREPGLIQHETVSPLWNLLWLWLMDDKGCNVLRLPNGEERYPEFDLYCAIARDVHNAVPAAQLTLPLFDSAFKVRAKDIPADAKVWVLQAGK